MFVNTLHPRYMVYPSFLMKDLVRAVETPNGFTVKGLLDYEYQNNVRLCGSIRQMYRILHEGEICTVFGVEDGSGHINCVLEPEEKKVKGPLRRILDALDNGDPSNMPMLMKYAKIFSPEYFYDQTYKCKFYIGDTVHITGSLRFDEDNYIIIEKFEVPAHSSKVDYAAETCALYRNVYNRRWLFQSVPK